MSTSDTGTFRRRQAIADLNRQRLLFPLATVRRIGAGIGYRSRGGPDVQRRLEWYFSGKAPAAELKRDGLVHGALLMASALPEDDFEPFVAATVVLLLERLSGAGGLDNGFWNWRRLAPHYRLAPPALRAAIMCGFREARRLGLVSLSGEPAAQDCLTVPREGVLAALGRNRADHPFLSLVDEAIRTEADAQDAGDLWATLNASIARLPEVPRHAAEAGIRYLYERPLSMAARDGSDLPLIPVHD
jgi:hypothetical protein